MSSGRINVLDKKYDPYYRQLGHLLETERKKTGKTLEGVAREVMLSSGSVLQRYEAGDRKPPHHVLLELGLRLLGDPYYFITKVDIPDTIKQEDIYSPRISKKTNVCLFNKINNLIDEIDDEEILLEEIIKKISNDLNIGIIAVFTYIWNKSEIRKTHEYISPVLDINSQDIERVSEEYNVWREQYVTELAWANQDEAFQFITDYNDISSRYPRRVNRTSYIWHERVLGAILSTMYGIVGNSEKRYLIRCFNRSDHVRGLLDRIQYGLLTELCSLISTRIDMKAKERSLSNTRDMCTKLAHIGSIDVSMEEIRQKIISESPRINRENKDKSKDELCGAIFWNETSKNTFSHRYTFGLQFEEWGGQGIQKRREFEGSFIGASLYSRIISNQNIFVVDVFEETKGAEAPTMEFHINTLNKKFKRQISCLLVFPFNLDERRKGTMIIPIEAGPDFQASSKINILEAIPEKVEILSTYASVARDVIHRLSSL